MANERVLIVEDEVLLAEAIAIHLEGFGYQVVGAFTTAEQAFDRMQSLAPDLVLMDIMLPGAMDGIDAARIIREQYGLPVVYLTAYDDQAILDRAMITEPFGYILKPYSPRELHANIAMALYKASSEKQVEKAVCSTEVFDSISDALIGLDSSGKIKSLNLTAESMLGVDKERVLEKDWSAVLHCSESTDQQALQYLLDCAGRNSDDETILEVHLQVPGQSSLIVEIRFCLVNRSNSILSTVLVIRDVSERKKVEDELEEYRDNLEELVRYRTQELSRINQELDTYNYSVSHDLRAPLRAIDGFSKAILEEYAGRLDGQGLEYLRRVRSASQRMGELIDDLLTLSRISTDQVLCEEINLSALAASVVDYVRDSRANIQARFEIQDNMFADGDVRLIRILLENLIDNAIKFTSKQSTPLIRIGQRVIDGLTAYFVCDNGIGFDMDFSEKIFQVFQRLHSSRHYEGTGVGLAIAQRIIYKHHGEIWAEGMAGEGACFYFTLDKRVCDKPYEQLCNIN